MKQTGWGAFAPPGEWASTLTNAGERYVPLVRIYSAAMHLGHMASYREALRYSYGRRVLDVGCGTGYGSFFLASYGAGHVVGVDVDEGALAYARAVYSHRRVDYVRSDALLLPFEDGYFDFVFSSQVIEHVSSPESFLREIRRVLSPSGFCLIVTPNQDLFSPVGTGDNPHHEHEMDLATFRAVAGWAFPQTQFRGIPQNCLEIPAGTTTPTLKPNAAIRQEDYCVRADNVERCENLVCYGHVQPGGTFSSNLPIAIQPAADQLAPFFWDSSIGKWVVMAEHPAAARSAQPDSAKTVQTIHSSHAELYRVEVDAAVPLSFPVRVTVYLEVRHGRRPIAQTVFPNPGDSVVLSFDPQPDSAGQDYAVVVQPQASRLRTALGTFLRLDRRGSLPDLSIRTFHACMPEPVPND